MQTVSAAGVWGDCGGAAARMWSIAVRSGHNAANARMGLTASGRCTPRANACMRSTATRW